MEGGGTILSPEAFEPSEGSLPLLSPPLGMWKVFPLVPVIGLAGMLLLVVMVALVEAFEWVGLGPDPDCWEGTAPFGACGVTLGLLCDPLAGVEVGLAVVALVDSEEPAGLSLSL